MGEARKRDFIVPLPVLRYHAHDPDALQFHVMGASASPHTHIITEDWAVDKKNALADHIERWHFRARDYSGDRA